MTDFQVHQMTDKKPDEAVQVERIVMLSCPFCDSDNIKITMHFHPQCSECGAIQEKVIGSDAIEKWNTRNGEKHGC